MLGHASAAKTLDIYAGLFADDLDAVDDRLDDLVIHRDADPVRTGPQDGAAGNDPLRL